MPGEEVTKLVYDYRQRGLPAISREVQKHNLLLGTTRTKLQTLNMETMKWQTQTSTITKGVGGLNKGMAGLALRFVGYNFVLNQVMGAQQKLIEFVKESITKFREFENTIAEVSTILSGVSMMQLPALRAGVESLSVTFGKAGVDLGRATYQILSAAFDATEAMELLTIATKASVAGLSTVEESVDILTSILNAYGKTVSQAARMSDYLFQTVVRGKLRFEDFNNALGYITPIAANAGVAFKEIAAGMSTATRMGLHADMTVRGLALGMQGFISPTEQAAKAAKKYGVEMSALDLRVHGLTGMIQQLHDASEEYGDHVINELVPNMRSFRVYSALAGDEGITGLMEDMDLLTTSAGKTEEAMGKIIKTTKFMADQLTQAMEQIKRDWGAAMTTTAIKFEAAKMAILGGLDSLINSTRTFGDQWYHFIPIFGQLALAAERFGEGVTEQSEKIADSLNVASTVMMNTLKAQYAETGKMSLYEALIGEDADINKVVQDIGKLEDVTARIAKKGEIQNVLEEMGDAFRIVSSDVELGVITQVDAVERNIAITQKYQGQLRVLESELLLTESAWSAVTGALASFEEAQDATEATINQITITLGNLADEVGEVGEMYDGTLGIQLKHREEVATLEDQIRALQKAMKDQGADMSLVTDAMKEHIAKVQAQKEAYDALSAAVGKNRLEIMKLELKGMIRRRGLLRAEQRTIKKFQIENKKIAIEQLEMKINAEEQGELASEEILRKEIEAMKEQLREMKDTRWEDIENLRATILEKEGDITKWTTEFGNQQSILENLTKAHTDFMASLYDQMADDIIADFERMSGYTITPPAGEGGAGGGIAQQYSVANHIVQLLSSGKYHHAVHSTSGKIKEWEEMSMDYGAYTVGAPLSWQRGTYYVPQTMPAIVHRGEQIIPAGKESTGEKIVNIYNTIHATINTEMDAIRLGALLQEGQRMKATRFGVR